MSYTPPALKKAIKDLKALLHNKDAIFGIDLLLPQVGGMSYMHAGTPPSN